MFIHHYILVFSCLGTISWHYRVCHSRPICFVQPDCDNNRLLLNPTIEQTKTCRDSCSAAYHFVSISYRMVTRRADVRPRDDVRGIGSLRLLARLAKIADNRWHRGGAKSLFWRLRNLHHCAAPSHPLARKYPRSPPVSPCNHCHWRSLLALDCVCHWTNKAGSGARHI